MRKRTALVTGGVGGIGSAICKDFLENGYSVIANYYPAEEKHAQEWLKKHQSGHEGRVFIVPGDVADFDSCVKMAEIIKKDHDFVDTLINCAGVTRDKTLRKMEPDMWNLVINIDLTGVYNVTKQFIDGMHDNEFGRIINISSVNGQKGQFGQTNYSAAKAGVHGFTMALAQEMSRKNVTVNTISPGYVETDMTVGQMNAEILDKIVGHVPMGRMARPEEVSYAVLALCDERASYISGTNLGVNGGFFMSF